ncbi:hypothetical protein ASC94_07020 [Massilia sp. Root418]|nr:hypothetical protein ASC94_07020 [Massilia sp. Root418]
MRYMATGYAQFIIDGGGKIEGDEDQFAQAIADASRNLVAEDAISVRPLIIAKEWLFRSKFPERNWHFVNQIHGISEELGQLVKIEYAVTRLSDLRSSVRSPIPLLMAVTTDSTAELLVRARMIKAKFPDIVLRIALITDDAVINARLVLGFSLLEPLVGASDLVLLTGLQLANTPS